MVTDEEGVTHSQPTKCPRKRGRPPKIFYLAKRVCSKRFQETFYGSRKQTNSIPYYSHLTALAPLHLLIAIRMSYMANCVFSRTTLDNAWTSCTQKLTSFGSLQLCHMHVLPTLHTSLRTPKPAASFQTSPYKNTELNRDKKFNIIIYGVHECHHGTAWQTRESHDFDNVYTIISKIDNSVLIHSIRDNSHLGRYTQDGNWPHPILVKLNRFTDVRNVLSKRSSLKGNSIIIKLDLSSHENSYWSHPTPTKMECP